MHLFVIIFSILELVIFNKNKRGFSKKICASGDHGTDCSFVSLFQVMHAIEILNFSPEKVND